jgi:hypothetical protein
MFTKAFHQNLPSDKSIHSIPPLPISRKSILILCTHLCLDVLNAPFPSNFPQISYTKFLSSHISATFPVHLIPHDLIVLLYHYTWLTVCHDAPHSAVFSNLLSLYPSSVKIFCSAPCCQTPHRPLLLSIISGTAAANCTSVVMTWCNSG